ncbi:MAG: hypothetical protein ACRDZ6_02330 [Acidimicrobiales bacterium]
MTKPTTTAVAHRHSGGYHREGGASEHRTEASYRHSHTSGDRPHHHAARPGDNAIGGDVRLQAGPIKADVAASA